MKCLYVDLKLIYRFNPENSWRKYTSASIWLRQSIHLGQKCLLPLNQNKFGIMNFGKHLHEPLLCVLMIVKSKLGFGLANNRLGGFDTRYCPVESITR